MKQMANPTRSIHVSITYGDYRISGTVVFGDYEGSADVERGRKWLPPYVQDDFLVIFVNEFRDLHDVTYTIDESTRDTMEAALIERAAEEMER